MHKIFLKTAGLQSWTSARNHRRNQPLIQQQPFTFQPCLSGSHSTRLAPRTKSKGRHPQKALTPAFIRSAPPGRHADGNGLYLFVRPSGTRSWIQRLLIRGRRRELGLGSVALVPLTEARERALANRKPAREGGDPLAEKRRSQGGPTFAEAAMRVLEQKQGGWRNRTHSRE